MTRRDEIARVAGSASNWWISVQRLRLAALLMPALAPRRYVAVDIAAAAIGPHSRLTSKFLMPN
jgi:hypothetical protein